MDGAFHCSCHANMTLDKDDPHKCVDLNECVTEGYCEDGECENIPNGGGFTCSCNKGFMKSIDKKTCKGTGKKYNNSLTFSILQICLQFLLNFFVQFTM